MSCPRFEPHPIAAVVVPILFLVLCPGAQSGSNGVALLDVDLVNLDDGTISHDRIVLLSEGSVEGVFPVELGGVPPNYDVAAVQGLYLLPAYVDVSLQFDLARQDEEDPEENPARNPLAGDLFRSGILTTLVPGPPPDSAAAAGDSLIRIPTGPVLDAPSGLPSRWPSPKRVALLNEQVPIPAQIRYIVPPEVPTVVLGVHVPGHLARRINQTALGQGLGTVSPAAALQCGTVDVLESGVNVVEGIGLLALGHAFPNGLERRLDEDARRELAWSLWEAPTAPQLLSRVLDHLTFEELDSLASRISEIEDAFRGIEFPPALCPELTFLEGSLAQKGYSGALVDSLLVLLGKLHRRGVAVVAGSGGLGSEAYFREIDFLQRAGIRSLDILRAACVEGALLMGRPDPSRLKAGVPADLVLVEGNPLEDPAALQRVRHVVRAGRLVARSVESD